MTFAVLACMALAQGFVSIIAADGADEARARIRRIENAVLAPCCYTEPVSRHQSEVAIKMRIEIAKWVAEGRTDQEILNTYVRQYGGKVLVDPRTIPAWWSAWIPWLTAIFGVIFGFWILRRWHNTPLPAGLPPSSAEIPELPDFDDED